MQAGSIEGFRRWAIYLVAAVIGVSCSDRQQEEASSAELTALEPKRPIEVVVDSDCHPAIRILGVDEMLQVEEGHLGLLFRPIIVGCAHQLATIDPDEQAQIADLLIRRLETGIRLHSHLRFEPDHRRELAQLVNETLGRTVATEVYASDYFSWEKRPPI